jgi:hypothetical protein
MIGTAVRYHRRLRTSAATRQSCSVEPNFRPFTPSSGVVRPRALTPRRLVLAVAILVAGCDRRPSPPPAPKPSVAVNVAPTSSTTDGERACAPVEETVRDRQVLEALALHLLSDPALPTDTTKQTTRIVLASRNPDKTGLISEGQVAGELKDVRLPSEAWVDLRRRNAKDGSWDTQPVSYSGPFDTRVALVDPASITPHDFSRTHPDARAYLVAFAPGYSRDGSVALVRALFGPRAHAASVTAVLRLRDCRWQIDWRKYSLYA